VTPVGRDLAEGHEALFVSGGAQARIGPEPGEGLTEAPVERRSEIADAIVPGWTIETVAAGAVFKQPRVKRVAEAKWVGRAADPPKAVPRGLDDLRPLGSHSSPGEKRLGCHEHIAEVSLADALRG
jgi:hypothetical protein